MKQSRSQSKAIGYCRRTSEALFGTEEKAGVQGNEGRFSLLF
jgi:hypothetical protein